MHTEDHMSKMTRYTDWSPAAYDTRGLGCDDRQGWYVSAIGTNRDADALTRSNWSVQIAALQALDPQGQDHEVHRFNHWGPGWFKIVLLRPDSACHRAACEMGLALADYPVLCDEHFSETECEEAETVWRDCYTPAQRIDYIRDHASQFEFRGFSDLMGCVRGHYFGGYASELLH